MAHNVEDSREQTALFLEQHVGAIADRLINGYVANHPESRSSRLSRPVLEEWTREELEELSRALRGEPVAPRSDVVYSGDLVKGGSSLFMPMANYIETKLIVGKEVAVYLWGNYPGSMRQIQGACEALEEATLELIRDNLDHYATSTLTKGCLTRHWMPDAESLEETNARRGQGVPATAQDALTRQESRVLKLVVEGKTNGEVAAQLGIAQNTVRNHLAHIYGKMAVSNRTELARKYFQQYGAEILPAR